MHLAMFVIGVSIALFVTAYVAFPAISAIFADPFTGWDPAAVALVTVLVILSILAIAVAIFKSIGGSKARG